MDNTCRNEAAVSILIGEDDALLRRFLIEKLAAHEEFTVAGSAGTGREVLEAVAALQPKVLLLDLHLPGISGFEVLDRLSAMEDRPRTLVLSGDETEATQLDAARRGAHGFLGKTEAGPSLIEAIRAVAAGEVWLPRRLVGRILNEYPVLVRQARDQQGPGSRLTEKERDVLARLARGMTNQQIANDLHMSLSTAKSHIRNIFKRFDLPSRTEAAVFAVREGLLEPTDSGGPGGGRQGDKVTR